MGFWLGSGSRLVEHDTSKGLDKELARLAAGAKPKDVAAGGGEGGVALVLDAGGTGSTGFAAAKAVASGSASWTSQGTSRSMNSRRTASTGMIG